MKIKAKVSARHIHLTKEDYDLLFDNDMTIKKVLTQKDNYATNETVTITYKDKIIENVRIVGPYRNYTQVELSRTDAYKLGLNLTVSHSGDLENAKEITISTNKNSIVRKAAILANRHIHITKEDIEKYNLTKEVYKVKVKGEKGGIFDNVYIKETKNTTIEMHIDTDDGNAFGITKEEEVELID